MKYTLTTDAPEAARVDCLVVGVFEKGTLSPAAQQLDEVSAGAVSALFKAGDLTGKAGQWRMQYGMPGVASARVLLVGCGPQAAFDERRYRQMVTTALGVLADAPVKTALLCIAGLVPTTRDTAWSVREAVVAASASLYRFDQTLSEKAPRPALKRLALQASDEKADALNEALEAGVAIADGTALARDLANLPGNICTPTYLAEQAQAMAKGGKGLKATVLEQEAMAKLGMGALLSVARGSRQPPKLIALEYSGGKKRQKPIVLVGKGLTCDSGGGSIMPAAQMDEMKYDMCGGAAVLGALQAVAALKLPLNVVAVVPASENMPDGDANKPGDVVTSLSGLTIEVLNTDAEGRLILCDALTWAERTYKPELVVDVATLTGACVIALGKHAAGLLGNDQPLVDALLAAGEESGDRAWQLPLWEAYEEQLKSNFADLANVGGREAGTVTAALFLARFMKKQRWAHLDIAGVAWEGGAKKGATGRPVALLTQFLIDRARHG